MRGIIDRLGWLIAGVLGMALVASLAGVIRAGPLDPPGSPGPTMRTLDEVAGSWDRLLTTSSRSGDPCQSERFQCVMNDAAVLDRETGLVWERAPSSLPAPSWYGALDTCQQMVNTGSRVGWRLPALPELMSLLEAPVFASLPDGSPFTATIPSRYWSSTTDADITANAFAVYIQAVSSSQSWAKDGSSGQTMRVWCVRGPVMGEPGP